MTPLRKRLIEDMTVRNLAPTTQATYVQQVSMFARYFGRSPETLGAEEIRSYQVYLAMEKKLAPSSISTAVAALRFLYNETLHKHWVLEEVIPTPKIPNTLPVVLSPEEVLQFLEGVPHIKHRTILTTCYAAGLRISEAVHLKPADIDSQRMVIRVEQGKGHKDRYVMLSVRLLETLRHWWRTERPRIGYSPASLPPSPSPDTPLKKPVRRPTAGAAFPNPSRHIAFDMRLPSICWKTEPMSARSSCC